MPARNMRRCETISASLGVSFNIGKKYLERRIAKTRIRCELHSAYKALYGPTNKPFIDLFHFETNHINHAKKTRIDRNLLIFSMTLATQYGLFAEQYRVGTTER